MADVNAEIGVSIDTSNALAQLKALQREIARFHASVAKSSEAAGLAQRDLQKNFLNGVNAIQGFSAELRTVKTTAESFTDSLEKNKFSMREYFRYSLASTKTFGRAFKSELDTVNKVAEENVKRLQTQYIKMGRDANGAMKAIAVMPTKLNMDDFTTKVQLAAQKQAIFNQLVKQGSTNLLNFGKNTQWAGRQLMVGFTIPLMGLGSVATKTFMDMETAAIKFRKVYGDLFTPTAEREQALKDIEELGNRFTKYGIAVSQTVGLAAEAAAAGFKGIDLQRQVTEATRLQVLGQVEQQKALETTISLQNAFRLSSADLADSINFLNAVENQTVVSLDDITTAIPKAAPIVRELGGDVKDLAFFMAAMKEGGINASEGANALKSGLASLINPTDKAKGMLADFGIDIDAIVNKNAGNVKQTVVDFAYALDDLSSLSRQRAIEQLFGKFQQARLSALFDNVIRDGNQASRVLDLAGTSTEELAALAEQELGVTANSAMNKFRKSVEDLKVALVPIGQLFLEILTPFLENIGSLLDRFNDLSSGTKKVITTLVIGLGAVAPVVLMTVGLFANFVANGIKGLMLLRNGYLRLTGQSQILSEQTNYLTVEQQQALAAAASLEQSHMRLQQVFNGEAASVRALIAEYQRMIAAQNMAATKFPGMMVPGFKPNKYNDGKPIVVGGTGNKDSELALLTPGETVIPADMSKKYGPLINAMIAGKVPGYESGLEAALSAGTRTDFAHITDRTIITIKEFVDSLQSLPEAIRAGRANLITKLQEIQQAFGENLPVNVYSGLGFTQNKKLNIAMGRGEAVGAGEFLKDFQDQGIQKWATTLKVGGVKLEEVSQELTVYDEALQAGVQKMLELNSDATITSEQFAALEREVRNTIPATSALRQALDLAENTITEYRINLNKQQVMEAGLEPYKVPSASGVGYSPKPRVDLPSGRTLRLGGEHDVSRTLGGYGQITGPTATAVVDDVVAQTARAAQTESPSRRTVPIGEDIARGLQVGMQNQIDETKIIGEQLGSAATDGVAMTDIAAGMRVTPASRLINPNTMQPFTEEDLARPKITESTENLVESMGDLDTVTIQAAETSKKSNENLYKWNNRLMSASFAISGLTGVASMFGANLGGVGEKIFQLSSAMFALQAIVQTLTQAKMLELVATRLAIAKQAAAEASYGVGMAARSGFLGSMGRFGVMLRTLVGLASPFTKIALVIGAGIALYKIINNRIEANRKKIDGLGDAALLAGEKLKTLEQFFGTDFRKSIYESFKYDEATAGPALVAGRREQAQALIENKDFQKKFKDTIDALRNATNSEAKLVLEGLAMQFQARGATREQIQTLTDALIKEAGKTDIVLDFAKIDIKTKEGQAELKKNVNQILKGYNQAFAKGINDSYRRTLNLAGKSITGAFGALQLQLEDGSLSAKEYAAQVANINTQILAMPDSQAKLNLVNSVFSSMGTEAAKAAAGVTNLNNKLLLAQAIMLGVADAQSIKNLSSPLFFVQDAGVRTLTANINKYIQQLSSGIADLNKDTDNNNSSNGKGITLQEKLIKIYQNQVKGLEKKLKALRDVNAEIDRQNQFMKDQVALDKQITEAKISGNYLEAAALSQQKLYNQAEFNRETQEIEIQKQIDQINERISYLEDKGKKAQLSAAEKKLLGIETKSKGSGAQKDNSKDNKKDPGSTENNGTSAGDFGSGATYEKNEKGKKDLTGTRNIPDPRPFKVKVIEKRGPTGGYTVAFNPASGRWEEVRVGKVPSGYITEQQWMRGTKKYAGGGSVNGPGTSTSDSIPAFLSDGEYVVKSASVDKYGVGLFEALNAQKFKDGGLSGKTKKPQIGKSWLSKQDWFKNYLSNWQKKNDEAQSVLSSNKLTSWMSADPLAFGSMIRTAGGQQRKGDNLGSALFALNFLGMGGAAKSIIGQVASRFKTAGRPKGAFTGFESGMMGHTAVDTANAFDNLMFNVRARTSLFKETNPFALRGLSKDTVESIKTQKESIKRMFQTSNWKYYYTDPVSSGKPLYSKASTIQQKINVVSSLLNDIKAAKGVDSPIGNITSAKEYIQFPRLAADAMASVTQRVPFGEASGTFYRGLSMHDMAQIAGYTRVPHPYLTSGKNWMNQFGYTETTAPSPWAGLASRWKKNASEMLKGKKEPAFGTEESLPYLDLDPALKVGETWLPDTIKSITPNLEWAKEIAVAGGTGGGQTQAIAKILIGPEVKGISNLQSILAGHTAHGKFPEYTEGLIAPYTKYILKAINKNAHHVTDDAAGVSKLIDEYVFEAISTVPRPNILKKSKFPELPIVPKMAMGGYINMASLPKFKNGIDNVPYDMPAMLHKNERVLTAEENRAYGQNNSTINAVFNITGGNSDEIVNKVMVKLNTINNKNNKSNKVVV